MRRIATAIAGCHCRSPEPLRRYDSDCNSDACRKWQASLPDCHKTRYLVAAKVAWLVTMSTTGSIGTLFRP